MKTNGILDIISEKVKFDRTIEKIEGESDEEYVYREYKVSWHSKMVFLVLFVAVFFVLVGYKVTLGEYDIGFGDVYSVIWHHLTGNIVNAGDDNVVWNQRMPRVLTAIIVGLGLGAAGAAMQSMMKNPLADPYTTGISSGALFGATLAMTMGIFIVEGYYGRVLNAFIFALVPAFLIIILSRWKRPTPAMMILVGISVMFIFNAFQSYMMLRADPNSVSAVYTWSVGSIGMTTWDQIPVIMIFSIIGLIVLCIMSRTINALNSGDEYAKSLGINVDHMRMFCMLVISMVAAGIVSFTGIIGFIGLVSPHIARIFVGSDNRILFPASALMGGCLMLICDIVAFLLLGKNMQIGIVTAMIGGPLFLAILMAQRKEVW